MGQQEDQVLLNKCFAKKQFIKQDSLLTTLIRENPQVRSLYNIIIVFVILLVVTICGDYLSNPERLTFDFTLLCWNLRDFYPHFILPWTIINCTLLATLFLLVRLRHWLEWKQLQKQVTLRLKESSGKLTPAQLTNQRMSAHASGSFLTLIYVAHSLWIVGFCSWYIVSNKVSISISFALAMEMIRLVMKAHSYVIETNERSLSDAEVAKLIKCSAQNQQISRPSPPQFSSLVYYLFAPTLIYRESYPRTDRIRWGFVLSHLVQMVLVVLLMFVSINRFLLDSFSATGRESFALSRLSSNIGNLSLLGAILQVCNFYALLHLWHNITGELLRFADRRFYDAWWESVSLSEFYRKWNLLVQDWLFAYIYVPMCRYTGNRSLATFIVILLSGVAHEYIIAFSLRFFFPALFVVFALCGHIYFLITRNLKRTNVHNIIFIMFQFTGWALITSLYCVEWYSRTNCPVHSNHTLMEHLVPRALSCVRVSFTK